MQIESASESPSPRIVSSSNLNQSHLSNCSYASFFDPYSLAFCYDIPKNTEVKSQQIIEVWIQLPFEGFLVWAL